MDSITISIPDVLREWIESRLEGGQYQDAGEYLRDLIRRDQEESLERRALIVAREAGEASGVSARSVPDILAGLRRELRGDAA